MNKIVEKIVNNVIISEKAGKSFNEKIKLFFMLNRLQYKSKLSKKLNQKCYESFFNYKVVGYSYYSLHFLFKEIFGEKEYFFETKSKNPIIIDCGANIGISMLYFKTLFPASKVICFEANPHTYELLEENIKNNKVNNVEIHNIALNDSVGEVSFFISENIGTLVGSLEPNRGGDIEIKCKSERLSNFLSNIEKVDLIKIDVEGAEWAILKDLEETNSINKADNYIVEYHHKIDNKISNFSEFLKIFENQGFEYNIKGNYNNINSFQDILIHFYKETI